LYVYLRPVREDYGLDIDAKDWSTSLLCFEFMLAARSFSKK